MQPDTHVGWTTRLLLVILVLILAACGSTTSTPAVQEGPTNQTIPVQDVTVQVGVGSPIPIDIVVSGEWPDLCAQLAQVTQQVNGNRIEISLLATPADPNCPPDNVGLPFRVAIPLNGVQLAIGTYTIAVNGVETTFNWSGKASPTPTPQGTNGGNTGEPGAPAPTESPQPSAPPASSGKAAYIGADGNLWVLDLGGGTSRQVTTDAASGNDQTNVGYEFPRLSEDGSWLAYHRYVATPKEGGMDYQDGLWIMDLENEVSHQVLDGRPNGYDWKPGSHSLVYGLPFSEEYFHTTRGEHLSQYATAIWQVEAEGGEAFELVKPERGYALVNPRWSPDGRFLSFEEVSAYEGGGLFAYYDFTNGQYQAWDQAIGLYSWSPDGTQIAYDNKTYAPNGEERIFLRPRQGGEAVQFSPASLPGYAFEPVFSPDGKHLAYLVVPGGPDSQIYTLYVQDLAGGEPRSLGNFESLLWLNWSSDGNGLVFSAGPYPDQQVILVNMADGSQQVLADGTFPDLSGR